MNDHSVLGCRGSGFSPGRQVRLIGLIAENVRCYGSGLPLIKVVDKVCGY